jgi:hypothetical protein
MRLWSLALICATLSACTTTKQYVRFTQEMRLKEGFSDQDLARLQYYVCPPLSAKREVEVEEKNIDDGTLVRVKGRSVETLEIPEWTPGISVQSTEHFLAISFERESFFAFGVDQGQTQGDYRAMGRLNDNAFEIPYQNDWFEMDTYLSWDCQGESFDQPRLWIDEESLKEVETRKKVLHGLKVDKTEY